jgi:ABC-type multidrug transport system ATPase subunit
LLDEVQKICSHVAIIIQGKLIISGGMEDLLSESDLFTTEIHVQPLEKAKSILITQDWIHKCVEKCGVLIVNAAPGKISEITTLLIQNECKVNAIIPKTSLEDLYLSKTESTESHT